MTILKKIFSMGTICEQRLKERDAEKIAALKMYLMERMGAPAGLHTAGIPLILSGFLSLFSFVIPQIPFWTHAFSWLNLPPQAIFAGIIPTGIIYCALLFSSMSFCARGYAVAFKFYLVMILLTACMAACNLIYAVFTALFSGANTALVISAVAAVIFSAGSYKLINSQMFLQTSAFYLHNRVWRWQLAHPANNKAR
ncbi:TPA: hypothetical protein QDZ66_004559 [Pluralibacter gergoviae]|uniref:Uncharacterized protein n=2 Tax=Pluralibacter gergoviae TaxID=61647 RepID=A0A0J5LXJ0_PLUGE|nr:hypothetical protein [Pluralibacter gergoviae]KMK13235.1 hypothetical protein ABW06_13095 [Pluralibacter gergoviae]KMK23435.1 hypothetical protein ABW10_13685 [Pluralibacter gergoviae]MBL3693295.1 hypothetical protein [Pluralibacter gergoviae]HDS1153727.1 hypothetical protein [Pluralibacter gergoviae]